MWLLEYQTLRFLAVDEAACRHYGYSREEFLNMSLTEMVRPQEASALLQMFGPGHNGQRRPARWSLRKKDGAWVEIEIVVRELLFEKHAAALVDATADSGPTQAQGELANERLRLALEVAKMGTWTRELNGKDVILASPELYDIFGVKPEEFAGTEEALFKFIHPEDHEAVRQAFARTIRGRSESEVEFRILPRNRPAGWMLGRGRPNYDGQGRLVNISGVAIDITQRKEAEQEIVRLNRELEGRVRERTAQLEGINKELEAFSYSVSHDLRAPLRSIRGFSELVLKRYAANLDERGRDFLRRACESCDQMDRLIEDLLQLSRLGRSELRHQPLDLSAMVQSLANELLSAEPQRTVQFIIEPGLRALGDERLLRVALDNMLRNAWKFTSKRPDARIEFGVVAQGEPAFFVRDNGAGFDMAYAQRLFGVFQRLHSSSEFPGNGVGLATVQRIISRHGGRVWASGALNQGATFYFSLPREVIE